VERVGLIEICREQLVREVSNRRGRLLPPAFGVPPSAGGPGRRGQLATDRAVTRAEKHLQLPKRTRVMRLDRRLDARLRARVALNRSRFAAARQAHSRDAIPDVACRMCVTASAETALHALTECPRYAARRALLRAQLQEALTRLRRKRGERVQWLLCMPTESAVLYQLIIASPLALAVCDTDNQLRWLLRRTGDFLRFVNSIRPI